jgi:hypothetical protein
MVNVPNNTIDVAAYLLSFSCHFLMITTGIEIKKCIPSKRGECTIIDFQ